MPMYSFKEVLDLFVRLLPSYDGCIQTRSSSKLRVLLLLGVTISFACSLPFPPKSVKERALLLARLISPLECVPDDLLQWCCPSLSPGGGKGLLAQLGACCLHGLLIQDSG